LYANSFTGNNEASTGNIRGGWFQLTVQLNGAVKVFCGAVEDAVKSKAVLMK
jgi:hypothetical protein